jgi:hypothetical protein
MTFDMRWMSDWNETARHPVRALTMTFLLGWLGAASYAYFRMTNRDAILAALFGAMIGLVLTVSVVAQIARVRGWPEWIAGDLRPAFRLWLDTATIFIGAGLGIAIAGAARGSLEVVLTGLSLIALGLSWHVIKRSTRN